MCNQHHSDTLKPNKQYRWLCFSKLTVLHADPDYSATFSFLNRKVSTTIWTSTLRWKDPVGVHRASWYSRRHVSHWALRSWPSEEVFRHHQRGSGTRSGCTPPPFILQQQLYLHFNRISQRASFASSPWQFLCRLVRLQARCSPTRPRQLFSTLPPENTISSLSHPIENTWQISGQRSSVETWRVQKNQKNVNNDFIFPPQLAQMMYPATYNCATD